MREVDITLDPFPCNGGTMSCESLWLGLPMVMMQTGRYMGRLVSSYLAKLGLDDLMAGGEAEYAGTAARLAANWDLLTDLRNTLHLNVEWAIIDYGQHVLNWKPPIATCSTVIGRANLPQRSMFTTI